MTKEIKQELLRTLLDCRNELTHAYLGIETLPKDHMARLAYNRAENAIQILADSLANETHR